MKRNRWLLQEIDTMIMLRDNGKTVKEIAAHLGRPLPSVKARLKTLDTVDLSGKPSNVVGRNNKSGVTWEIVRNIRTDWKTGMYTLTELNTKYGFNVRSIVYNRSWKENG